jgi:hypothetical protein
MDRYALALKTYEETPEDDRAGQRRPVAVNVRAAVGKELWLAESESFREEVTKDAEKKYEELLAEWEASQQKSQTPQQFHQNLLYTRKHIEPVATAIAQKMQAAVSIFIIGPVGEKNGEVEVRRYIIIIYWIRISI